MTVSADDRWLADARARVGSGGWERDAETIYAELRRQAEHQHSSEVASALGACPACAAHPSLLKFPRHELLTNDPIAYCGTCYGFWAVGDALSRGVADAGYVHPALEAVPAPRRCKRCFGHLKPDDVCAKCGQPPEALSCPLCQSPMQRFKQGSVSLDQCSACQGTWFDTGEITAVYKLKPAQSLAMATVDEHATDSQPPAWLLAAHILGRMFLPFL